MLWAAPLALAMTPLHAAPGPLTCAAPQAASAPATPMRQMQQHSAADGTCLQSYVWQPVAGPVRGVVVIVHGIRDHAERYAALAEALAAQHIAVLAQDHRGHGRSGGARQRFDSVEQLMSDVELGVQNARQRFPGVPVFMFGHSMGGLVAVHYALANPQVLKGVVLSGPALRLGADASAAKRIAVQVLGRVWPSLALQAVDDSQFVRTGPAKAAQASDPLIVHDDLPAASVLVFLHGIESARARFGEFSTPLLAMHGAADLSTDPQGSRDLVERAAARDKTMRQVPAAAHDLLHEPEAPDLVSEIVAWVTQRL
jgi:acylglycerol lipase